MRVLSYNIHKGFSSGNLSFVLKRMKEMIRSAGADIVLLQEVLGHHEVHGAQLEYLADELWPHFAYGKNAVYASGHHGNAILSKLPIIRWENEDVSRSRLERRGLLHAQLGTGLASEALHVICVHLGLFESDRTAQLERLCERVRAMVPDRAPLIVGGDFNDWRELGSPLLRKELGLSEVFLEKHGSHAGTFPSWLPMLKLDRLYFRGLSCRFAGLAEGSEWRSLSDHLPIVADLELPDQEAS